MKEEFKKKHSYTTTKVPITFDDGLAECQSAFLVVAGPLTDLLIQGERMRIKVLTLIPIRTSWKMP